MHTLAECRLDILNTKVELWLKKRYGARWATLEQTPEAAALVQAQLATASAVGVPAPVLASKPVEPYASKKKVNWDRYVSEQTDLDNEDPLNKVFKEIYGKGSEDHRRAMQKSYVESGGTVLSTNWEDISKKHTDPSPPEGMEARSWNDHKK